jgi:dolichyl-phosphate-mannose-protein mannosyltransferase
MEGIESPSTNLAMLCGTVLLVLIAAAITLTIRPLVRERDRRFAIALGVLTAITIVKLTLLPFYPGYVADIRKFELWGNMMARLGPAHVYDPQIACKYTPAYLYALWASVVASPLLAARLPLERVDVLRILVESPPIIADVLLCASVYAGLRRMAPSRLALPGTMLLALSPSMIYTSTFWGQNDSVLMLLVMLSVLLAADSRYAMAWAMAAIAMLIKPQGLLLLPVLAWWTLLTGDWRVWLKSAAAFIAAAIVVIAPFQVSHGWHFIIDVYESLLDITAFASFNAFNLMAVLGGLRVPDSREAFGGISYFMLGNLLLACVCVLAGWILWAKRIERSLLFSAFLVYLGLFVLETRVHERYLYFAVVLLTPLVFASRATVVLWAVLTAAHFINIVYVKGLLDAGVPLYGSNPIATAVGIVNLTAFAVATALGFVFSRQPGVRWPVALRWAFSPPGFVTSKPETGAADS